jgi:hypothetical protein
LSTVKLNDFPFVIEIYLLKFQEAQYRIECCTQKAVNIKQSALHFKLSYILGARAVFQ